MKKENIVYNDEVIATIIYAEEIEPGVHFYGENDNSLQVGKQLRMKGEKLGPHKHLPVKVERQETLQEVLYIEKGKVKVIFYDDQWGETDARVLNKGDMILLMRGGHGFEMLEETVMIEVKQGPYDSAATQRMEARN
ncbi:MAG: hypothetical protein KAR31_05805 [Candidatus Omnitrophica bacterium]|nr:hypothetical protein [Candidatus Omnitrophota bacterium]